MENQSAEIYEEDESRPKKEDRLLAAIAYAPFGFILPFLMKKESPFLTAHVKQGAIVYVAYFLLMFLPIPFTGWLFTLLYFILAGYPAYKAYNGEDHMYAPVKMLLEALEK